MTSISELSPPLSSPWDPVQMAAQHWAVAVGSEKMETPCRMIAAIQVPWKISWGCVFLRRAHRRLNRRYDFGTRPPAVPKSPNLCLGVVGFIDRSHDLPGNPLDDRGYLISEENRACPACEPKSASVWMGSGDSRLSIQRGLEASRVLFSCV